MEHWSEKGLSQTKNLQLKRKLLVTFLFLSVCSLIWFGGFFLPLPLKMDSASLLTEESNWLYYDLGRPSFSPEGDKIATFHYGVWQIHDLTTGDVKEWKIEAVPWSNIEWLSTTELVFQREVEVTEPIEGERYFQFWVLDIQTGHTYPLNEIKYRGWSFNFRVSSSKTKIAFVQYLEGRWAVSVMDLENNAQEIISKHKSTDCNTPIWLSNDSQLLYTCQNQLWKTIFDSGESEIIADLNGFSRLSLSPNEKWLAYVVIISERPATSNIRIAPVKNGIPDFSSSFPLSYGGAEGLPTRIFSEFMFELFPFINWSPDSQHLVVRGQMRKDRAEFYAGDMYVTLD